MRGLSNRYLSIYLEMLPLSEDIEIVKRGYTFEHRQETDRHHFPVPHVPLVFAAPASPRMLQRINQSDFDPHRVLAVNAGARGPVAVSSDRALCLPTFSHFLIVNKTSLSVLCC